MNFCSSMHSPLAPVWAACILCIGFIEAGCISDTWRTSLPGLDVELTRVPVGDTGYPEVGVQVTPPRGVATYYVAVQLFDPASGLPVSEALVAGRVVSTIWIGPRKPMEPVAEENRTVYGTLLDVPEHGPFRIRIEVEWPSGSTAVDFLFDY